MLHFSPHHVLHDPRHRRTWRWIWAASIVAVALGTLLPGDLASGVTPSDKIDHLLGFAALAAAGALSLAPTRRSAAWVAAGMVTYGALIELLQTRIPGRHGDLADLLADTAGVAIGLLLVAALRHGFGATGR